MTPESVADTRHTDAIDTVARRLACEVATDADLGQAWRYVPEVTVADFQDIYDRTVWVRDGLTQGEVILTGADPTDAEYEAALDYLEARAGGEAS